MLIITILWNLLYMNKVLLLLFRNIDKNRFILILNSRFVNSSGLVFHDFNLSHPDFQHLSIFFTESALNQLNVDETRNHNDDNISNYVSTKCHNL